MTTDTTTPTEPTLSGTKPPSKSAAVIKLLTRARGATIAEVQTATGWQPHSVRAYLSGLRKAGRTLEKEERKSGETSYRLLAVTTAAAPIANPKVASATETSDKMVGTGGSNANAEVSA